jgi:hypothetical protein
MLCGFDNKWSEVKSMSQVKWDAGKWSEVKREVGKGEKNEMSAICVGFKKTINNKLYTVLS